MDYQTSPEWQTIHTYRTLLEHALVEPLKCPVCSSSMVTTKVGKDDLPQIKCYSCQALTTPGLTWYAELSKQIKEILPE